MPLKRGESGYTIINGVDCNVNIHGDPQPFFEGNVPPLSVSIISISVGQNREPV